MGGNATRAVPREPALSGDGTPRPRPSSRMACVPVRGASCPMMSLTLHAARHPIFTFVFYL